MGCFNWLGDLEAQTLLFSDPLPPSPLLSLLVVGEVIAQVCIRLNKIHAEYVALVLL